MASSQSFQNKGQQFTVRRMNTSDPVEVSKVLELWAEIGLHEGTGTIQSFAAIDPNGFLVTTTITSSEADDEDDKNDELIIGCVAGVQVDPELGHFLGLYAVKPAFQGRGLGLKMWNHLMEEHVSKTGVNAGLYAVPEHLHTYRDRAGFRIEDPDRKMVVHMSSSSSGIDTSKLVQRMGNVDIYDVVSGDIVSESSSDGTTKETEGAEMLTIKDLESRVSAYDSSVTGIRHENRRKLLSECFREKDSLSLAAVNKFDQKVVGYICVRTNNVGGSMVGPLYADDDAVAEYLMTVAITKLMNGPSIKEGLIFMPFDSHPGSLAIGKKLNLIPDPDPIPRFFTSFVPANGANFRKIYCIHSPNFFHF